MHYHIPMAYATTLTICSLFILLLYPTTILPDLVSDRAALLALRSTVGNRSVLWKNADFNNPCSWTGVGCSHDNSTVLALRLPGTSLAGIIPPNTISNLTNLRTLSLRYNSLTGPLPYDISRLSRLRNLYLRRNLFTGPLPDFIFSLTNIVRLDLSENGFSGLISASFNNLTRLGTLNLQYNNFSGPLPDLNPSGLAVFNVSNNHLTGPIPIGIAAKYPQSAFEGNTLCGEPLNALCATGNSNKKKGHLSGGAIAGIVIGSVVGLLILVIILWLLCRKKGENEGAAANGIGVSERRIEVPRQSGEKDVSGGELGGKEKNVKVNVVGDENQLVFYRSDQSFNLEDLLRASAEVLGKGTLGTYYKVILEVGITVAVKRLKDVIVSEQDFKLKVDEIGNMDHQNLVPLIGYYFNKGEKLLVYDYLTLGSLSSLLHGSTVAGRTTLNWETRLGIALGAARGISYLHSLGPLVSHGNVKSSNILITTNYEARLTDYCLSQLVGPSAIPNRVAGYRAPEVEDLRNVSQKADIYSYGVLLMELLTGKGPSQELVNDGEINLVRWVHSVVQEEWTAEVFDPEILRYQNVEEDMIQLLQLAIECTSQEADTRPLMDLVISRIQELHDFSLEDRTFDLREED